MLAIQLASAGREVTLLEKERAAHHKVCGEFLSREAVEYLRGAGVDPLALGAATIRFIRLSVNKKVVHAVLPFTALSLSRYALDEALLARAAAAGCNVQRGAFVESLANRDGQWHAQLRDGASWSAPTAFLATGKHTLRGFERAPCAQGDLVGFKLHWRLAPAQTESLREYMELFLFSGGYGGLCLVEEDIANLCLVVRRTNLRKLGGWPELLAEILDRNIQLSHLLECAQPMSQQPLAIASIPYGYLAGRPNGLWCIGDQAAVIPSFTGDGMSIALHSAALAAQMVLDGKSSSQYHRTLHAHLHRGMSLATLLSRAMVTTPGRTLAPFALSLFPSSIRWIASSTRIPEPALTAKHAL
jgi:flavin-dependent dehydrogenase